MKRAIQMVAAAVARRWFVVGFAVLWAVFMLVMLLQPGAVGRGGR